MRGSSSNLIQVEQDIDISYFKRILEDSRRRVEELPFIEQRAMESTSDSNLEGNLFRIASEFHFDYLSINYRWVTVGYRGNPKEWEGIEEYSLSLWVPIWEQRRLVDETRDWVAECRRPKERDLWI